MLKIIKNIFFISLFFVLANCDQATQSKNNSNSVLIVKVFSSLTCPHCADFHGAIYEKLKNEYIIIDRVKFEHHAFPLDLAALNAETSTGETPSDIAETTWNLGFAWDPVSDLSLIADARYVDERYHASQPLHDYTVVDASAHWAVNDDLRISLKADNLFDELYASGSYWWGTWIVGKPRTLSLALDYSF